MSKAFSPEQAAAVVKSLPLWSHDHGRRALKRSIVFPDFPAALAAMIEIGFAADGADHHPEWSQVYDRLDIWLTTHDAGGVSERDVALAAKIDEILHRRLGKSG